MRVNYGQTVHGEAEIEAVVDVLRTSTQMGARVREMQVRVARLFDKRHGVMVNSGSSANYLAIELLGLPPGSEVITPALTFATTVAPIIRHGLVPVFVDAAEATYNIDVDAIEAMIGANTRAMMIPSLIGNLPDWDRIRDIADHHGLLVIEDSADTLVGRIRAHWGEGAPRVLHASAPQGPHEATLLRLDNTKARTLLGWRPRLSLNEAAALTVEWYRSYVEGSDALRALSEAQVDRYTLLAGEPAFQPAPAEVDRRLQTCE